LSQDDKVNRIEALNPGMKSPTVSGTALSGETRVIAIVGDPVAQVKSPAGVTRALVERGRNCVVIPVHVAPGDLDAFMRGAAVAKNFDGIIATVPHKFAAFGYCSTASERARLLGAANVLRRSRDGAWHGDMLDGIAFVEAMRAAGCEPRGRRALLVGAGGAGSAIGLALLDAGVAELAVHDGDARRRDDLLARLATRPGAALGAGSADPTGYTIIANATPAGMRPGDPYPVEVDRLTPQMFVGDVVTEPAVPPLITAARRAGCATHTGSDMFAAGAVLVAEFMLGAA
jgi:shikimate dehydrogenase